MDEKDNLRKIKRIIIIISALLIVALLISIIVTLSEYGTTDKGIYKIKIYANAFIYIEVHIILIYILCNIFTINNNTIKFRYKKDLSREIPIYPPAVCSYLYNRKNEVYIDYTATILNLEQKGFLKLIKDDNDKYSFEFYDSNIQGLSNHELYTLQCVKGIYKLDINEFKNKVHEDMTIYNLLSSDKHIKNRKRIIIYLITLVIITITEYIFTKSIDASMYLILLSFIAFSIYIVAKDFSDRYEAVFLENKSTEFSKKAKNVINQVTSFKKYLSEYTLIKERNIDYRVLLDQYVPYALALGEGKTVEEFIKNNEQYRDLIYRNREN